jgi:hypothetical protein
MAIEKTRAVQRLEVYPGIEDEDPRVMVVYENTFDDSEDDELPVVQTQVKHLSKTTTDNSDPENPVVTDTDVSGEDALVQTVCGAIWA